MKHATLHQPPSFALLFDPALALEAANRAAQWNLPRHICHPLDRYVGRRVNTDLAAFDAEVELAPLADEELADTPQNSGETAAIIEPDFEDDDFE